jgi:OmpA-OmpF porin, OOP family
MAPPPFAIDAEESRRRMEAEAKAKEEADAAARRAAADAEAKRVADADAARKAAEAAEAKRKADDEAARKAAAEAEAKRVADAEAARKAAVEAEAKRVAMVCENELQAIAREGVIRFAFNSAALDRNSNATLDKLAAATTKCPGHVVRIEAHTDSVGEPEFNQTLSQRRAESVVAYLTKAGVAAALIKAEGFGETQPIADNATPEGRAENRRIVFKVVPKS